MYLEIASRVLLGVVFLAAVVGKVLDYPAFVKSVRDMGLRPERPLAISTLAGEVAIVALLGFLPLAGFVLSGGMLLAFAIAIAANLRRGSGASCRCFGRSSAPLGWHHVWRNVFLIAVAALGALAPTGSSTVEGTILAAGVGLLLGGLIVMLDDLIYLFRPTPSPRA